MRTVIIGLGTVSRPHRKALALMDDVELVAVADVKPEKKEELPEGVHFYEDYKEMLDKEKPDAAHICLPHYLHLEAATECAKRGINILCEKPSNMNGEQLRQMQKLEDQYQVKLAICFQNRLNPTFVKLQEMIGSGEYGKLLGIKAVAIWSRDMNYYQASPWRASMAQAGGGCMINQAIHTLDQMQLLGGPIKNITGQISNLLHHEIEVEDTAVAHIEFENGVAGFGFLALAVMIFGQWKPVNIGLAALLFGLFRALSNVYTGFDALVALKLPSTVYNMLPYIISLIVLIFVSKKSRAPKAEGIPYDKGQR